jgi:hypothetical protein
MIKERVPLILHGGRFGAIAMNMSRQQFFMRKVKGFSYRHLADAGSHGKLHHVLVTRKATYAIY